MDPGKRFRNVLCSFGKPNFSDMQLLALELEIDPRSSVNNVSGLQGR